MKKNDIFTFTASNVVEVTGVVIDIIGEDAPCYENKYRFWSHYMCYAQNRLFYYSESWDVPTIEVPNPVKTGYVGDIIVDYCILPEYDKMLEEAYLNNHKEEIL